MAHVVAMRKTCGNCRKLEDLQDATTVREKKSIGLRKSDRTGPYRERTVNVQERTGPYRSLKVDVEDGGRPKEVMLKPNHSLQRWRVG